MENTKALDEAIDNLKQLVVLYEEITEDLIGDIERSNRLLEEANRDIEKLQKENEKLGNDYNSLLDKYRNLDEENKKQITKIAELKQKKSPSIDTITKLMSELQDMLLKAKRQNDSQDSGHDVYVQEENPVFDLRKDKASDEDGF